MYRAFPSTEAAKAPPPRAPAARTRPRRRRAARVAAPTPATSGARTREIVRHLLSIAPQAVFTVRASGAVGLWNAAASELTGRRRRQVLVEGLGSLFRRPSDLARLAADLERHGQVTRDDVLLRRPGGEEVPVRVFATVLRRRRAGARRRREDPERHLVLLHDLSEVHRIRRRLIETEKLSAMAKIAGSVAHEFRNPLNSLFLATDLLEDELEEAGAVRKAIAPTLAAIREEVDRLNEIITHYLALSKISTSRPEVLDLGATVREFAGEWRARAAARGVELRVRVAPGRHPISVDPNQIRRVLVNLVENAFDAVAGEGRSPEAPEGRGVVTLSVRPTPRSVKLTVEDNGPGVPPELRERVFEPFISSKATGSGLGLYIVREIVLAHGGQVALGDAPGGGTSLAIRWPKRRTHGRSTA